MVQRTRYLSLAAVSAQERKKKRLLITGAILTVFFAYGIIAGIMNQSEGLRKGIPLYIICLIPSVLVLLAGFNVGRRIDMAKRFETIFANDRDGVVTFDELARQTAMSETKVFSQLETLFRKGFFQNCSLQSGGVPCVLLGDAMVGESGIGFADVVCQSCGASTRIRAGSRGVCAYCGAPVADTQIKR